MDSPPQSCKELKQLILNSSQPIIFKKYLNWELLSWNLETWENLLKNENLKFRCGKSAFTKEPQWERTTINKTATFNEFITFTKTKSDKWMYFDYKYLREWFNNVDSLKKNIDWGIFGFPELSSQDSTIWIGSMGAHTPCHIDTYGCNLISQIYGRKQWILFPPEEDLRPSRIPYEESSIYSRLNFFSPTLADFKDSSKNCRKIILEPGDALFVPQKWWHYVENLETAISVNVWIPLPTDNDERLKEALVQFFISQVTKNLDGDVRKLILNPNSDQDIEQMTLDSSLDLINQCKSMLVTQQVTTEVENLNSEGYFEKYKFLQKVPVLTSEEFLQFLKNQRNRFTFEETNNDNDNEDEDLINLINAFSNPSVMTLVKNNLTK